MSSPAQQPRSTDDAATAELTPDAGWRSFRRLLTFWGPFRWHVATSALLAFVTVSARLVIPWQAGTVIDAIKASRFDDVPRDVALLLGAAALMAALNASRRIVAGTISLGIEKMLRERLFDHLSTLGASFFDRQQTGQLLSRVTSDVSQVRFFLGYGLTYFFMHGYTLVAVPVLAWVISPTLALVVYAMMPVLFVVSLRFSRRSHPILKTVQQRVSEVTAHGEETIVGSRVVRAFGQEQREVDRFRALTDRVVRAERRAMLVSAVYKPLYNVIPNVAVAAILLLGARQITSGQLTLGEFVTFFLYTLQLTGPVRIVGNLLARAQRATASGERIWELLDAEEQIPERDDPLPVPTCGDRGSEVRFEGVSFGYREGRRVLRDVTLTIPAGATVALLGPTGCGKSTLASLVPRFYDPDEGRVLLDGVDLRDMALTDLRRSIGIVDQEPFLFSLSIADNLRYGRPDATDEEAWAALDAAQAREFVERLPQGIDTVVGERGLTLSGGQRQRLAIARALVVDPHVLILDDATASVDSRVEARISDALSSAARQRTTIVIAHRPSTIALADHIVVMQEGRIEDQGSHDELLARNRTYQLVHEQRAARREFLLDPAAESRDGHEEALT